MAGAAALLATAVGPVRSHAAADTPAPRLNQLGFLPRAPKRFVLPVPAGDQARRAFVVETLAGRRVLAGQLDPKVHDLTRSAGEFARVGDFSALVRPGRYRVRAGQAVSHPFQVGDDVYTPLTRDAARAFHLIRANVALDDPVTGLRHAAGHASEASLVVDGAPRDLTGGWYNAGDYGKWTHMAAISVSQMLWLYVLRPQRAATLSLDLPSGAGPGLPDLLQQARWGLEWLLKMQNPDGAVLHKVDSQGLYAWGLPPEQDAQPRAAHGPSSLDAGVFVGVMLQADRAFAPLDPAFAARCRTAALRAWAWLEAHPKVLHDDPNYKDPDPAQEALWATCEMAVLTGDPALATRAADGLKAMGVFPFFWPTPQLLGAMSLARSEGPAAAVAKATIVEAARAAAPYLAADPYGFTVEPDAYTWGSVELVLNLAVLCLFAAELGQADGRDLAQGLMDYVLGRNALDHGFVTGHGEAATRRPYHWTCRVWGIVMPGWASGGPNGMAMGADPRLAAVIAAGTPPARCYVDACEDDGSWASNEGQTSQNAALLLAAGLLGW